MTPEEIAAAKAAEEAAKNATPGGQTDPAQEEKISLTPKELEDKITSEADKRVTSAIKTREENLRKEAEEKVRKEYEAKAEADRKKAKMSADERAAEERKELEEKLAKAEADKLALEESYKRKELVAETLATEKLDPRLSDFLTGGTREELKAQADMLNAVIADEIKKVYSQDATKRIPGEARQNTQTAQVDFTGKSLKEALRESPVIARTY